MSLLQPDRYFDRISSIDVERDLLSCGLEFALLDVDNTVRSRADNCIPRDVREWVVHAKEAGVGLALFSNSWHESTMRFGEELDLPVVMRSVKPLPIGTVRALRALTSQARDRGVADGASCGAGASGGAADGASCGAGGVTKATRNNTVVIGDQVFTDVLSAHAVGMRAFLVVPLSKVNIKSAGWQRALESRILTGWVPEPALALRAAACACDQQRRKLE